MATASEKPDLTPVLKVAVWRGDADHRGNGKAGQNRGQTTFRVVCPHQALS